MATPTQILAQNVQRPLAKWLPHYLRALATAEERSYRERLAADMAVFVDLMDEFEECLSLYVRNPDWLAEAVERRKQVDLRQRILVMASDLQVDAAAVTCDCDACAEATARSLLDRSTWPYESARDLRVVAATLCRSTYFFPLHFDKRWHHILKASPNKGDTLPICGRQILKRRCPMRNEQPLRWRNMIAP